MKDLFRIEEIAVTEDGCEAKVCLDPCHAIFSGHFPGQPVLPGVCTLRIIKAILEEHSGRRLMFSRIASCKYLSAVIPGTDAILTFRISFRQGDIGSGKIAVRADGRTLSDRPFLKLKAELKELV